MIDTASASWTLRLCDFGFAFHERCRPSNAQFGTRAYSPPEARLPQEMPTRAADNWALGCTLFEFCSAHQLLNKDTKVPSEVLDAAAVGLEFLHAHDVISWQVAKKLLVEASHRETAGVAATEIVKPTPRGLPVCGPRLLTPFVHEGNCMLEGHRGQFVFLEGPLEDDLLTWLHEDLKPLACAKLRWFGSLPGPGQQNEGGIKIVVGGNVGMPTLSSKVNTVANDQPGILLRYNSFCAAFNKVNSAAAQAALHEPLVEALSARPLMQCDNAAQIREQDTPAQYLLNHIRVSLQSQRHGPIRLSTHDDGSAGMLLLGLQTPAGGRELHFQLRDGTVLVKACAPGHVYLCNIAAALHQVVHPVQVPGISVAGLPGATEIAIIVRSTWFGHDKARGAAGLEGRKFYRPTMDVINKFLSKSVLRLPSLAEVKAEHAEHAGADVTSPPAKRYRRKRIPCASGTTRARINTHICVSLSLSLSLSTIR